MSTNQVPEGKLDRRQRVLRELILRRCLPLASSCHRGMLKAAPCYDLVAGACIRPHSAVTGKLTSSTTYIAPDEWMARPDAAHHTSG